MKYFDVGGFEGRVDQQDSEALNNRWNWDRNFSEAALGIPLSHLKLGSGVDHNVANKVVDHHDASYLSCVAGVEYGLKDVEWVLPSVGQAEEHETVVACAEYTLVGEVDAPQIVVAELNDTVRYCRECVVKTEGEDESSRQD